MGVKGVVGASDFRPLAMRRLWPRTVSHPEVKPTRVVDAIRRYRKVDASGPVRLDKFPETSLHDRYPAAWHA
jgi:hypothetical protein